jgi:type II secretory pathway component PulM
MSNLDKLLQSSAIQPVLVQWNQLSQRDRIALKALGIFFGLFALYSIAIKPVFDYEATQKEYFESRLEFLKEVKSFEPDLLKARSSGASTSGASTSLVNRLARQHKLAIKQISPDKDNQVRATFENVDAVSLLGLIQELSQKHDVVVVQGSIDRRSAGKVNAKLVFGN